MLAAVEVVVALGSVGFLSRVQNVNGFNPSLVGTRPPTSPGRTASSMNPIRQTPHAQSDRQADASAVMLQAATGGEGRDADPVESYKKQMEEFMAAAHEKRLQAMEAVKAEVQRGYEEQIAELQSQLTALPKTATTAAVRQEEPALVGATAGGSSHAVGSRAESFHSAYAARSARPGWEARWGSEEAERTSSGVSTADVNGLVNGATADTAVNPAYTARIERPGWEARWGAEELQRSSGGSATSNVAVTEAVTPADAAVTPAYAARLQRPGWETRWGDEEPARVAGVPTASVGRSSAVPKDVDPAYAARLGRPGWEARWGAEEPARASGMSITEDTAKKSAAPPPSDVHPAYAARLQRPGWEVRWGDEEPERVAGVAVGEIAKAGAAAGFVTAGGLEEAPEPTVAATTSDDSVDATVRPGTDDPLVDKYLPQDVVELQDLVVSSRRQFQDYLIRSLEANNDLKVSKAKLETELSSLKAKLAEEEDLRRTLQASYLNHMSRNGEQAAEGKTVERELIGQVARLKAEAADLKNFAQEYMVKAAHDKRKAVEEADANARAESSEHIKGLQAQILKLQAGG